MTDKLDKELVEKCLQVIREKGSGLYKVSTSPEPYAFSKEDGTLVSPNIYNHVRLGEVLAKAIPIIEEEFKEKYHINIEAQKLQWELAKDQAGEEIKRELEEHSVTEKMAYRDGSEVLRTIPESAWQNIWERRGIK